MGVGGLVTGGFHPLDPDDPLDVLDAGHDFLKVGEVPDGDGEVEDTHAVLGLLHLRMGDVRSPLRDDGGDGGQHARLVLHRHPKVNVEDGVLRGIPDRRYQAVLLQGQVDEVGAVRGVDDDPAPPGDIAHDFLSWDGAAASRQTDQKILSSPANDDGYLFLERDWSRGRKKIAPLFRKKLSKNGRGRKASEPDPGIDIFQCRLRKIGKRQHRLKIGGFQKLGPPPVELLGFRLERAQSDICALARLLLLDPVPDPSPGPGGRHKAQPVLARRLGRIGDDFDHIPALEDGLDRNPAAVDSGPHGVMADFGVDAVGEVDRRRPLDHLPDIAGRGEDIDLVRKEVQLDGIHEFLVVGQLFLPFHKLAEPGHDLEIGHGGGPVCAFLVVPVGGDPLLGDPVHLLRPDLELHQNPLRSNDRGVEGLVHVGLRHGDEVLDPARHGLVDPVQETQDPIAVELGVRDHPDPHEIVDLVEGDLLERHLPVDAVDMLVAALDAARDPIFGQGPGNGADDLVDVVRPLLSLAGHPGPEIGVGFRIEDGKGKVLQFEFDPPDSQAVGQRGIDIERFLGDVLLFRGIEPLNGSHVVKPIGQLDQQDANVLGHREEHLPEVFGLFFSPGFLEMKLSDLRDPVDHLEHFLAEGGLDLLRSEGCVLEGIVKKGRHEAVGVDLHLRQDHRDIQGMIDVGVPRLAHLAFVGCESHEIGLADEVEPLGPGVVPGNGFEKGVDRDDPVSRRVGALRKVGAPSFRPVGAG